ncbi:MAG: sigma-70 family RNA polymerase sigma factor [Planctomycetes bacterium]|nr:sigma-70 family RNA polymerase sigma factor [Planctomycetota bacterium]
MDACEIVHAGALRALAAWPRFRGRHSRSFWSWFSFYVRSEIWRHLRARTAAAKDGIRRQEDDRPVADPARRALLLDEVLHLFGSLDPRSCWTLWQSLLGLPTAEIARRAARSPSAVRKSLRRIRASLRVRCQGLLS